MNRVFGSIARDFGSAPGHVDTVIELFKDTDAQVRLVDKVTGTPINRRFGELFSVDSFTALGKMPETLRGRLGGMQSLAA